MHINIAFQYTKQAETHFIEEHAETGSIEMELTKISMDISGITVQTSQSLKLPKISIPKALLEGG